MSPNDTPSQWSRMIAIRSSFSVKDRLRPEIELSWRLRRYRPQLGATVWPLKSGPLKLAPAATSAICPPPLARMCKPRTVTCQPANKQKAQTILAGGEGRQLSLTFVSTNATYAYKPHDEHLYFVITADNRAWAHVDDPGCSPWHMHVARRWVWGRAIARHRWHTMGGDLDGLQGGGGVAVLAVLRKAVARGVVVS